MIKLDDTDRQILQLLQANSRMTIKELANSLNLSTTPIFDRMKKLERTGIIDRYVAIVDPKSIGKKLVVFLHISIKEHDKASVEEFVEAIVAFEVVLECHHVTGDADFILKLIFSDIEEYNRFVLDRLSILPNIGKIESRFSLSTRKSTTVIPIVAT